MSEQTAGRWRGHTRKTTVEECRHIDINRLVEKETIYEPSPGKALQGVLKWASPEGGPAPAVGFLVERTGAGLVFRLRYRTGGKEIDLPFTIEEMPCHPGGVRWWWRCRTCGRRCGKLYLPQKGYYFACRMCHNLSYASRNRTRPRDRSGTPEIDKVDT